MLAVVCGELLAPPLQAMAKQQKAISKFSNISFAGRGGAWVRDGNLLINVMQQSGSGEFGGMRIFELTPDHKLESVATASTAQGAARWQPGSSRSYAGTRFGGELVESEREATPRVPVDGGWRFSRAPWRGRASSTRARCGA